MDFGRMRVHSIILSLGLAAFALVPSASQAELVTSTYTFSYSGFAAHISDAGDLDPKAPFDHWTGSFTISYDPSAPVTAGSVDSFSSNLGSDLGLGTFDFVYEFGDLVVGTDCSPYSCAVKGGQASAALAGNSAAYSMGNGLLFFGGGSVRLDSQVNAVPESSTWAMLLIGFAAIGAMKYRQRSQPSLERGSILYHQKRG